MKSLILKHHELATTLLIGLVTILTAFTTFTGSLWGSTAASNYSKSIIELSEANTAYLEYVSDGLDDSEVEQILKETEDGWDKAEELLTTADTANGNNDKFLLMTVVLAIAIFFGSMSLVARQENTKFIFFLFSFVIFMSALVWTVTLPMPF